MKTYLPKLLLLVFTTSVSYAQLSDTPIGKEKDTVKNKTTIRLDEVLVQKNPFKIQPTLTRSTIKVMDLPQNVQTIDKAIIYQQQAVRLSDVLKNVNGAYVGSARGGAQESFWSRGYDLSANNIFKNGFRVSSGSLPEVISLERIEFLKGNSALLFGNVVPGGVVNLVTKTPQFTFGGDASFQIGSYDFYKPSVDIYGPLSKSLAYRLNTSYENSKSFRDVVQRERIYINPSLLYKINSKTELTLNADYLADDWTPDFGTAIIGKTIVDLPRDLYLGGKWSNGTTKQTTASLFFKHQLTSKWTLNANSAYQHYHRFWTGTDRIQPAADGSWARPLGQQENNERILAEQAFINGEFFTANLKHQFTGGIDFENAFTETYTFTFPSGATTYGSGNIYDFSNFNQGSGPIPTPTTTRIVENTTNRFGAYAQDLISLPKYFKVFLGLRWSWQEANIWNVTFPNNQKAELKDPVRIDKAFSPKIGFIYQPNTKTSFFVSYSNSFTPNTGLTPEGNVLKPSIITQYEAGIKREFIKEKLNVNFSIYSIVNDNFVQTAPFVNGLPNTNTNYKIQSGETVSKGFEFDFSAYPAKGWTLMAGFSYNDMRFTKTEAGVGNFVEGDRLVRTPYQTANFSTFYKIQKGTFKGLNFGAMASYLGRRLGGWNNDYVLQGGNLVIRDRVISLSDYTTVDASVGYDWKKIAVLVKLSNITNALNYTVHENYSVNPIAPRQIMATVKYKF